jgi:hypothetical protein
MMDVGGWVACEHRCPEHGAWKHHLPPDLACHLPIFADCGKCIMIEFKGEHAHLKLRLS